MEVRELGRRGRNAQLGLDGPPSIVGPVHPPIRTRRSDLSAGHGHFHLRECCLGREPTSNSNVTIPRESTTIPRSGTRPPTSERRLPAVTSAPPSEPTRTPPDARLPRHLRRFPRR